jgi:hypothetical protein
MDYTEHRRNHLSKNYYFFCQCDRCADDASDRDMFSLVCQKCRKPEIFVSGIETVPAGLECSNCGEKCSKEAAENYAEIGEIVRDKLNEVTVPIDVANFCLNQVPML